MVAIALLMLAGSEPEKPEKAPESEPDDCRRIIGGEAVGAGCGMRLSMRPSVSRAAAFTVTGAHAATMAAAPATNALSCTIL